MYGFAACEKVELLAKSSKLQNLGGFLFIAGFAFIVAHSTQAFWSATHVLSADSSTPAALLVTEVLGGTEFAFHQTSKTGDVPKVLPLNLDSAQGAVVILIKNWHPQYDTRWIPTLMQQQALRLTNSPGERRPTRVSKSGRPTRTVMRLPWGGTYEERVFDLVSGQPYFLLLPQHVGWHRDSYSVEIRQRKNEEHFYFLVAGFMSAISGLLLLNSQRKSGLRALDPIKLARTYQYQGRVSEAKAVLVQTLKTHPNRSVEIRRALTNLESLK